MKRVLLLAEAINDLEAARDFYEAREIGAGEYCVEALLADVENYANCTVFIGCNLVAIECSPTAFHLVFTTGIERLKHRLLQY